MVPSLAFRAVGCRKVQALGGADYTAACSTSQEATPATGVRPPPKQRHRNRTVAERLYRDCAPGYMARAKETDVTFVNFMSGGTGRAVRIVVGPAMIAIGLVLVGGWSALAIVGPCATGGRRARLVSPRSAISPAAACNRLAGCLISGSTSVG